VTLAYYLDLSSQGDSAELKKAVEAHILQYGRADIWHRFVRDHPKIADLKAPFKVNRSRKTITTANPTLKASKKASPKPANGTPAKRVESKRKLRTETRIALQPAGSSGSRKHFEDTIESPVDLASVEGFLAEDFVSTLSSAYPNGKIKMWGVTRGRSDANVVAYKQLSPGDLVLFAGANVIFWGGWVRFMFQNEPLARHLWGEDGSGRTLELMYALDPGTQLDIAVPDFNVAAGYAKSNPVRRFMVMNEERSSAVIESLSLTHSGPKAIDLAANAWNEVTRCAAERRTIEYGELADVIGCRPIQVGRVLSPIQDFCIDHVLPPLTVLAISKAAGSPGKGHKTPPEKIVEETRLVFAFAWSGLDNPFGDSSSVFKQASEHESRRARRHRVSANVPTGRTGKTTWSKGGHKVDRDPKVVRWVKEKYRFTCQLCEKRLVTPNGPHSEGCHIIPLGQPHLGDDRVENVLSLCPNCHVLFDSGALIVDESMKVRRFPKWEKVGCLRKKRNHLVDESLRWHRDNFGFS